MLIPVFWALGLGSWGVGVSHRGDKYFETGAYGQVSVLEYPKLRRSTYIFSLCKECLVRYSDRWVSTPVLHSVSQQPPQKDLISWRKCRVCLASIFPVVDAIVVVRVCCRANKVLSAIVLYCNNKIELSAESTCSLNLLIVAVA